MKMFINLPVRIPNSTDGLECLPAALAMATNALGEGLTLDEAKAVSGYKVGVETWPYRMLAWLASHGYRVIHIDSIAAEAFAADPIGELVASGFDDETIDYFKKISSFDEEAEAIHRCLEYGVEFRQTLPEVSDIPGYLSEGWVPILTLDAGVLVDEEFEGYQGHMVIVSGADEHGENFIVEDSGPPARWSMKVPGLRISQALRTPTESSGTITLVASRD